jgi:hypothetical protein
LQHNATLLGKALFNYEQSQIATRILPFSFAMIGEFGVASIAGTRKQTGQPRWLRDSD